MPRSRQDRDWQGLGNHLVQLLLLHTQEDSGQFFPLEPVGIQTGVSVGLAQGGSERLPRGDIEPEDASLFPSPLGTLQSRLCFLESSVSSQWGEGPSRTWIRTRLEVAMMSSRQPGTQR